MSYEIIILMFRLSQLWPAGIFEASLSVLLSELAYFLAQIFFWLHLYFICCPGALFIFVCFLPCWVLNQGLHACLASSLPLNHTPGPCFTFFYFETRSPAADLKALELAILLPQPPEYPGAATFLSFTANQSVSPLV